MNKLIYIFRIFVMLQITSCAPVSDDELKIALKSLNTEQIRELARLFYDQQVEKEASNANVNKEQILTSEKEVEANFRYETGNHPKRSQSGEDEIDAISVAKKENPNQHVNGNYPKRSQNAHQKKEEERNNVKEEQLEDVDEVPAAREELPEPMVAELGMVKVLRQLSHQMAQNWDTLDELIERMETGSSKKSLYRDQAEHSSFLRRAQRLLVDLDNRQYPNDQHNLILEDMSRMIQLRMRQGAKVEEEKEVVEMTTMGYYTTGGTWGKSLFDKEVEGEDINTLQENDETFDAKMDEKEVDIYHEVYEREEDELMSKLESILEELRQLE